MFNQIYKFPGTLLKLLRFSFKVYRFFHQNISIYIQVVLDLSIFVGCSRFCHPIYSRKGGPRLEHGKISASTNSEPLVVIQDESPSENLYTCAGHILS